MNRVKVVYFEDMDMNYLKMFITNIRVNSVNKTYIHKEEYLGIT